jgi:uncharacterized membrane protein YhaH (DUF805 family)
MTAARLPMITVLMGPVATAAAAASFCTVNIAGARIPALTLCRRRLHDVTRPGFARFTGVVDPFTERATCRCDRPAVTAAFKSP